MFIVIAILIVLLLIASAMSGMSRNEARFSDEAYKLHLKGMDAKTAKKAEEILLQYEALHDQVSSSVRLKDEHIYREDIADIRENYQTLSIEEWQAKAGRILDQFYELYDLITNANFKDVEKAYRAKKRCIGYWQDYYASIPYDTGIWYDAKRFIKDYLGDLYDDCMSSHELLEKKITTCIEEMKPEYKRKMQLRKKILDYVANNEGSMRAELMKNDFEGCTPKEAQYCYRELVEKYQIVEHKIGSRYFVYLSDKEKAKRNKHKEEPDKEEES